MPMTKPTERTGRLSQNVVMKAVRIRSTTAAVVILVEAPHQRSNDKVPAVHQYEQKNFERRGDHYGRELHHPDGKRNRSDHQVDDQEWQKQDRSDLKGRLEFADYVRRYEHRHWHVFRFGRRGRMRKLDEKTDVFLSREF